MSLLKSQACVTKLGNLFEKVRILFYHIYYVSDIFILKKEIIHLDCFHSPLIFSIQIDLFFIHGFGIHTIEMPMRFKTNSTFF